jgi:hypothetical protein
MLRFVVWYPAAANLDISETTSILRGARGIARSSSHWRNSVSDIGAFRFIHKGYELTAT